MELEYQNTKDDYLNFYKAHLATQLKKRLVGLLLFSLLIAYAAGGQPLKGEVFLIVFFVAVVALFSIIFLLPYLISIRKLNKSISEDNIYLEKRKLSTTETGIIIHSISKTTEWNWHTINSFRANENYIYIQLADKTTFFLPKRFFTSENEIVGFLGIVQTGITKARGTSIKNSPPLTNKTSLPICWDYYA